MNRSQVDGCLLEMVSGVDVAAQFKHESDHFGIVLQCNSVHHRHICLVHCVDISALVDQPADFNEVAL
jgi:hypothetical protein